MKKKRIGKKMILKKTTVTNLLDTTMNEVRGGTKTTTPSPPGCICDSILFCSCPDLCPY